LLHDAITAATATAAAPTATVLFCLTALPFVVLGRSIRRQAFPERLEHY